MEEKFLYQANKVKEAASASYLIKMKKKASILLAEDDQNLAFLIKENLELAGYDLHLATDGEEAYRLSVARKFDLFILDVMMPRKDGFWVAEQIRKRDVDTPIVFLTAKNSESAKIEGFMTGADDYMTKPFSLKELLLRLTAILKRTMHTRETPDQIYKIGKITFNFLSRFVSIGEQQLKINIKEAEILKILVENKNSIVPRRTILIKIWGGDDYFLSRSMDVYMTRLRKLIRMDPSLELQNVYGTGFKLIERKQ
jgi:DNA-binding response OmpR family regulator